MGTPKLETKTDLPDQVNTRQKHLVPDYCRWPVSPWPLRV